MASKSKKEKNKSQAKTESIDWMTCETRGFLILSFSILLFLSLISFAKNPNAKNLIGQMGHSLGWSFHAFFGLSSYLIALYLTWMGWRLLLSKPIKFLWLKNLYVAIAVCSLSMLFCLIETDAPTFAQYLGKSLYPGLWSQHLKYHLGGAPFFYLFHDIPALNLYHIFNTVGVALIFSTTFTASLIFLFKIRLVEIYQKIIGAIKQGIERHREQRQMILAASPMESNKTSETKKVISPSVAFVKTTPDTKTSEPESDFLRFVKLRIPTTSQENLNKSLQNEGANHDLLEIKPEKNPKARPSISRKEQTDQDAQFHGENSDLQISQKSETVSSISLPDDDDREAFKKRIDSPIKEGAEKSRRRESALIAQSVYNGDFSKYVLPPPALLTNPKIVDQTSIKKDLKRQAEVLEETLLSFGIEAKVGQINCGPTITSFEVHPAIGVKVQKIKSLDNDIALNMEAKSIRIIAPIPGKAAVGIEVPNSQPQEVAFKDILLTYQQLPQKFNIPILLGKAVNGDYVMSDLAKMPHCIIAGATGSGKSVCINTIVMSIVLNCKPDEVKLIMVDPKKVELTPYTKLPHMLSPVITEPQGAAAALNWLVKEMENRYEILKLVGARNIDAFNKRKPNPEVEAELGREIPSLLPFIVGIIDELADLMMVASQDIETPIARIAQMARAVGIHLILATQRPSREVITGIIKANFPTRIAFKVASRVNSQIILDEIGAESLLGNGDMLFLPPGSSHLIRAQGAFIRDEDIQSVVSQICAQAPPNYVIQSFDNPYEMGSGNNEGAEEIEFDSLYEQAKETVLNTGNASTTFLQRKLKIGYARAASLMDQLELKGIVGPIDGSKPRKIYARKDGDEQLELQLEQEL